MSISFKTIVEQFAYPHLRHYVERIITEKEDLHVAGVPAFAESEHN